MKWFRKIVGVLLVVLVLIQFIQPSKNKSDEILSTDITRTITVPKDIHRLLSAACYDCHSNNTNYPWYSGIQPFGWLLQRHIKEGKAELNFSEFGVYSKRRQISKLNGVANSIQKGTMPISSYARLHKEARLNEQERNLLVSWANKIKDSLRSHN